MILDDNNTSLVVNHISHCQCSSCYFINIPVPGDTSEYYKLFTTLLIVILQFLNKTLKEFVYSWYNSLSTDESFILELRQSIRYAASVLLRRVLQVLYF